MSVSKLSDIFDVGADVLATTRNATTGLLTAQTGDAIAQTSDGDAAEIWQQPGLASRPAVPVAGKSAAQCIKIKRGDNDAIIAWRDARSTSIYGSLADGETCLYSSAGQGRVLLKKDGSINLYTVTGNAPGGQSVLVSVSPTAVSIGTPWGMVVIDQNGINMADASGTAGISIAGGKVAILGTTVTINGGSVSIGSATASPATPALLGPSGMAGIPSSSVFISP